MLPQTAQTTESEEKPHRSRKVIRKARRKSRSPGTSTRARKLLGEFCGFIAPAPPPAEDPPNGPARHPVAGREGSREGRQGRPRGGDRRRAGRAAAVGARRGEDARQGHDRDRAGAHRRARQDQAAQPARTYTVRSGDTLSGIAGRYYRNSGRWTWIYAANRSKIHNPNSIYVGEKLTIPNHAPTGTASYTAKHAKKPQPTVLTSSAKKLSGNLSCSGLEALWVAAGGASRAAFMAAEIAMAESGGRQYAHSPTNDFGYWQINGGHGPRMATYNPIGNAKAAIAISEQRDQLASVDHLRHRRLPRPLLSPGRGPSVRTA